MRFTFLAATMLLVPAAAAAQTAPRAPVTVEIVGSGAIDVPASSYSLAFNYTASGVDDNAAHKVQDQKDDAIRAALRSAHLPDSALTLNPPGDTSMAVMMPVMIDSGDKSDEKPTVRIAGSGSIRATTLEQANALRSALGSSGVSLMAARPEIDDTDGARRQAKAKALAAARADAEAYGHELGLRVTSISRISEAGHNLLLPGLQTTMQQAMSGGPRAMMGMFQGKPDSVHVDATIIVEFVLAP